LPTPRLAAAELGPALEFRKQPRKIVEVERGFLWIDAEDFTDYGGWLLDTQFVYTMGSAYLIAASVGKPVEDATISVEIPRAGKHRLWVRAKNWLKEHSPGRFSALVNGHGSGHVLGAADSEDWLWESAGAFNLEEGPARIALRDLSGYYGRCDALILTTDLDYVPPADVQAIQRERARLTGLSLQPRSGGQFDVIVVGAGAAGSCAAIASARMGASTALVQNRPVLGGNASIELGVGVCGAGSSHPNARESGIIEEAGRIRARYECPKMTEPFRRLAKEEENLKVFFNQHVFGVDKRSDSEIAAVKAIDTLTGQITVYRAKMFIDCTGDGWVGYYAGADYRLGRESRDEFGEDLAPEKQDQITMSGCIMGRLSVSYRAEDTGRPATYRPPPWAAELPTGEEFGRNVRGFATGHWWLEHPGWIDDLWDPEKARDELLRITYGYWDYVKNGWPDREQASSYRLVYVPIVNAKRETRRLMGDYLLTQQDVQEARVFPDRISYGGWSLDVHHPEGVYSGREGPFDFNPRVPIYTIPYRCLYSRNIENLLFAGRDVSVTHVALGSVRVQGTLATLGQAAGTAAAMCVERVTTPRGIYRDHIHDLQQTLLKHDQYIPEIKNEDPRDLARSARVTASSTAHYELFDQRSVQLARDLHPLNMPRAVMFPMGAAGRLDAIHLWLASENDKATRVTMHVRQSETSEDFSAADDLDAASVVVAPGTKGFVKFELDQVPQQDYVWVWLEPTRGISWRLMESAPIGSCRAYGGTSSRPWHVVPGQYYAFYTEPSVAIETTNRPERVVNGVARIVGRETNMWASDPSEPLPQWIALDFETPQLINTVYLTFDTDLNAKWHTVAAPAPCVRDYELECFHGGRWISLATVKGNFQRRRVHRFADIAAAKLRLTAHATNGHPSARVFEIRAHHEARAKGATP
jgi:hypothetical protein